jgi:hypothetical protein
MLCKKHPVLLSIVLLQAVQLAVHYYHDSLQCIKVAAAALAVKH